MVYVMLLRAHQGYRAEQGTQLPTLAHESEVKVNSYTIRKENFRHNDCV